MPEELPSWEESTPVVDEVDPEVLRFAVGAPAALTGDLMSLLGRGATASEMGRAIRERQREEIMSRSNVGPFGSMGAPGMRLSPQEAMGAAAVMGGGLTQAGQDVRRSAEALSLLATAQPSAALEQIGWNPPSEGELPYQRGLATLPPALRAAAAIPGGMLEAAPRIAAMAIPSFVAPPLAPAFGGLAFGLTPEGLSPQETAIGAIIPSVGGMSGRIARALAEKMGISSLAARNVIEATAHMGGPAAYLGTIQASEIAGLAPEDRPKAIEDAITGNIGFLLMALPGGKAALERGSPRELARLLDQAALEKGYKPRVPDRRLGVRVVPPDQPFAQPGVQELAGAALEEAGRIVKAPGPEAPALEALRRELQPPEITGVEGRVSLERPREAGETIVRPGIGGLRVEPGFERTASDLLLERISPGERATIAEKAMLQRFIDEEANSGGVVPQKSLPKGVSYRKPTRAPTPEEYQRRVEKDNVEAGLTIREIEQEPVPETPPKPTEMTSIVSETGRRIVKPRPLSALQRSRLRVALANGAGEEVLINIMRMSDRDIAKRNPPTSDQEFRAARVNDRRRVTAGEPTDLTGRLREIRGEVEWENRHEGAKFNVQREAVLNQKELEAEYKAGQEKLKRAAEAIRQGGGLDDYTRYNAIKARMFEMRQNMGLEAYRTEEYLRLAAEMESIKNRNGGMPPAKPSPAEEGKAEPKTVPPTAPEGEGQAQPAAVPAASVGQAISEATRPKPGMQASVRENTVEAEGEGVVTSTPTEIVTSVTNELLRVFPHLRPLVESGVVVVTDGKQSWPENIRRSSDANNIEAAYLLNTKQVLIDASKVMEKGIPYVMELAVHEVAIHKGLRVALGEARFGSMMEKIWKNLSEKQRRDVMRREGIKLDPFTGKQRQLIGEEWLAYEAARVARSGVTTDIWSKISDVIRQTLRKLGFKRDLSDTEIAAMIAKGWEGTKGREAEVAGGERGSLAESVDIPQRYSISTPKIKYYEDYVGKWTPEERKVLDFLPQLANLDAKFWGWVQKVEKSTVRNINAWNKFLDGHPQELAQMQAMAQYPEFADMLTPDGKLKGTPMELREGGILNFHRNLPQMFLDRINPDTWMSIQSKLVEGVEHAYQTKRAQGTLPMKIIGLSEDAGLNKVAAESKELRVQTPIRSAEKTVAAVNLNSACPEWVVGNRGCWVDACYLSQMARGNGVNLFERAMYAGELLQLSEKAVAELREVGLRVNGVGDTIATNVKPMQDIIRHAGMRGIPVKIITKQELSFRAVQEAAAKGQDVSHVVVQPSIDYWWRPIADDMADKGAGAREIAGGDKERIARLLSRKDPQAEAMLNEIYGNFGKEVKLINGKWYRKDGFTWDQVNALKQKYPDVKVIPRMVVGGTAEIMDAAMNHPDAVITFLHGKMDPTIASDFAGTIHNYGSSRHWFYWNPITRQAMIRGEKSSPEFWGTRKGLITKEGYTALENEINKLPLAQRKKVFDNLKRQTCCQENDSPDACADCVAHCALRTIYSESDIKANQVAPLNKPGTTGTPEARMGVPELTAKGLADTIPPEGEPGFRASRDALLQERQKVSSEKTSRKQVPEMFKRIGWSRGTRNIDIGGGKYDEGTNYLQDQGVESMVYDPFNRTLESNRSVAQSVISERADTATVANVLNVIKERAIRDETIRLAAESIKPDGKAYFSVYEGKGEKARTGAGEVTRDGFQANRTTESYVPEIKKYFRNVVRSGRTIIASDPKVEGTELWSGVASRTEPGFRAAKTLADAKKVFEDKPKVKAPARPVGRFRSATLTQFHPLTELEDNLAKALGVTSIYGQGRPRNLMAGIFEQLKGSRGKAEADIIRFDREMKPLLKGDEKNFNTFMFLQRTRDRLQQDAAEGVTRRKVNDWTIPEVESALRELEAEIGSGKMVRLGNAAAVYQRHLDNALRLQVASGRMSQDQYNTIKSGNQFYAPFKVLRHIELQESPPGAGKQVDTKAEYVAEMTGIEDKDVRIGDMMSAARASIVLSRILADKAIAMQKLAEVAVIDRNGMFVRKMFKKQIPSEGWTAVNVFNNGVAERYQVPTYIADAFKMYGPAGNAVASKWLALFSMGFRAGATAGNLPFQVANLFADVPRAALVSRYGIRRVEDAYMYPLDFVHALYSSFAGNVLGRPNALYYNFLDSGAAGSSVQEYLTGEMLRPDPTAWQKSKRKFFKVLDKVGSFSQAIEQTSKVLGIKRAMRFENARSGAELQRMVPEAITEVRRFSGSPDFGRQGSTVQTMRLNLLFMFLNARIQGVAADTSRLMGADGKGMAAVAWTRLLLAVGLPTTYLYLMNTSDEYKDDYAQRSDYEKKNYWLIPKDKFITTEDGERIRDFWRIPKRETAKWVSNLIESSMDFAKQRDPAGFQEFAVSMLEDISPVNIQGDTAQERLESTLASLNPAFKAPLELATGRDMYRHQQLIPESMRSASPELQYKDRTPAIFRTIAEKWVPDIAPAALRSPIMLENLTRNLTAGLFTQFLPVEKPVEGRTWWENLSLAQRFQAMPYVDNKKQNEVIDELKTEAADEFLVRHRKAQAYIDQDKKAQLDDIFQKMADSGELEKDPKLANHIVDLFIARDLGVTSVEKRLLSLPVATRAKYVIDALNKAKTPEAKEKLWVDWAQKRVLTEDTAKIVLETAPDILGTGEALPAWEESVPVK